jgi:hypothetical protein
MGYDFMFRMQSIQTFGEDIYEFKETYENIMILLSNKEGKTNEERFLVDRPLNEEFRPRDWHRVDPGFFTIFTRMYPNITFRLFDISYDLSECLTYIFKGEYYAFEKRLKNSKENEIIEINGIKFRNENYYRAYHPENFNIVSDIMNPDDDCASPPMENLNFVRFEGFSEEFNELIKSWK